MLSFGGETGWNFLEFTKLNTEKTSKTTMRLKRKKVSSDNKHQNITILIEVHQCSHTTLIQELIEPPEQT